MVEAAGGGIWLGSGSCPCRETTGSPAADAVWEGCAGLTGTPPRAGGALGGCCARPRGLIMNIAWCVGPAPGRGSEGARRRTAGGREYGAESFAGKASVDERESSGGEGGKRAREREGDPRGLPAGVGRPSAGSCVTGWGWTSLQQGPGYAGWGRARPTARKGGTSGDSDRVRAAPLRAVA